MPAWLICSEHGEALKLEPVLGDVEDEKARIGIVAREVPEPVRTVVERRRLQPPLRLARAGAAAGRLHDEVVIVPGDEDVGLPDRLPAVLLLRPPVDRLARRELIAVHHADHSAADVNRDRIVVLPREVPVRIQAGRLSELRHLTMHEKAEVVGRAAELLLPARHAVWFDVTVTTSTGPKRCMSFTNSKSSVATRSIC